MPLSATLSPSSNLENSNLRLTAEREKQGCREGETTPLLHSHAQERSRADNFIMNIISWCSCQKQLANRKILVDVFAIFFGIAAWIAVNGMFMQLPLLVQTQPEQWNLPSYLSVIVQVANIGPILYSISHKMLPGKIKDSWIIFMILIMGCVALLLMTFLYKETTIISGEEYSTSLFALSFFIALVGCTSSVLFMPFMSNFREIYLISYFVGEGLSGFLPSIVALVQGVGGNPTCVNQTFINESSTENVTYEKLVQYTPPPLFSTQIFFAFLFVMMLLGTVAFFLLNNLLICKSEKVKSLTNNKNTLYSPADDGTPSTIDKLRNSLTGDTAMTLTNLKTRRQSLTNTEENVNGVANSHSGHHLSRSSYHLLLVLVAWVCVFGNGVFPSIQSYSCLPYGNVAYHFSVTLSSMANPLACFIAFFTTHTSVKKISVLVAFSTGISIYIAATALLSPTPPLVGSTAGEALVVVAWVLFTGLISYVKVSTASLLRREPGRALFWCGAVQQMGSAIGAVTTFFLVNYANIFHEYYPCR